MDLISTTLILNFLAILGIFGQWKLEFSSGAQAIPAFGLRPLFIFGQWEMEFSSGAQAIPAFVLLFILNPLAAILAAMRWKFRIYLLKNLFVANMHPFYKNNLWNID